MAIKQDYPPCVLHLLNAPACPPTLRPTPEAFQMNPPDGGPSASKMESHNKPLFSRNYPYWTKDKKKEKREGWKEEGRKDINNVSNLK